MVIFQCHVGFEGGNDRIGQPSKNHQSHPGQESVFGSQSSSRAFRIPTKRRMRAFCTNKSSRPKPPEFRVETPQNDWGGLVQMVNGRKVFPGPCALTNFEP